VVNCVDRNRTECDPLRQIVARDEFHDESGQAPAFSEAVHGGNGSDDSRTQGPGFSLEPRAAVGVAREGLRLNRDIPIQLGIARAKNLAHPARTNLAGRPRPAATARRRPTLVELSSGPDD
jgi:hypothetical protein